jgi:SAM-dependent methyltransferase
MPDINAFADYINIGPDETVLDLGTGLGWVLHQLRLIQIRKHSRNNTDPFQPPPFVGVDASLSMITVARAITALNPNLGGITFVHDYMSTVGSVIGQFDVITCRYAFHHLPPDQRQATLARWKSFLAPGGRIVFDFQGDTPIPCTMDICHPDISYPSRASIVPPQELEDLESAFNALLVAANLELVAGKTIRVAGINNHDDALCTDAHFASTGGGYDDHTVVLEAICESFRDVVGRDANLTEKCLLTRYYMEWVRDEATRTQPRGTSGPRALLYVKNLSLVAMVELAEE